MNRDVLTDDERERVGQVFQTHRRYIEAVAAQYSPSQDVPDIVQAVGVQVCRGLNGFRGESELTTWLYRVTVNVARNWNRTEVRFRAVRERFGAERRWDPGPIVDPDQVVIQGQRLAALQDAVARLRPEHRRVAHHEMTGTGNIQHRRETRYRVRRKLRDLMADDPRIQARRNASDD